MEEKSWHEALIPLVAGKKKEKKEKGLHWTCFLNFRLSQKTEQNRPGSTLKKERMEMEYVYIKELGRKKNLLLYWLSLCPTEESKAAVKTLLLPFWRLQCP